MNVVAGEDGAGLVRRLGGEDEALLLAGLPLVLQVAVAAGAFVAKVAAEDVGAFADQLDAVLVGDLSRANR